MKSMFAHVFDGIFLAKDNTIRIPDCFARQIGAEKIAIYDDPWDVLCLCAVPLANLGDIDEKFEICFGHFTLRKNNRLYLPEKAQQYAKIEQTSELLVCGGINYFEIWSEKKWVEHCDDGSESSEDAVKELLKKFSCNNEEKSKGDTSE